MSTRNARRAVETARQRAEEQYKCRFEAYVRRMCDGLGPDEISVAALAELREIFEHLREEND